MRSRTAFTLFLLLATVGLLVLEITTDYADLPPVARYGRSAGVALLPWVVGFIVAVIATAASRRRPRGAQFRDSLEGAVLVMLLLLYALALFTTPGG